MRWRKGHAVVACAVLEVAVGGGFAVLALDPLPDLDGSPGVHENDEVLVGAFFGLRLDLAPHGQWRNRAVRVGPALEDSEVRFLRNGRQGVGGTVDFDGQTTRLVVVPAQALHEETRKVEGL